MSNITVLETKLSAGPPLWALKCGRRIMLKPTRNSLLLLCPILPTSKPLDPLSMPAEVWSKVLAFAMNINEEEIKTNEVVKHKLKQARRDIVRVCKAFKTLATPILYATPALPSPLNLHQFTSTLLRADQRWDSIRRIPFSTPGRWVTSLDLTHLTLDHSFQKLQYDTSLTRLFPLTPFLSHLALNPNYVLSKRAISVLRESCAPYLKCITGLAVSDDPPLPNQTDALTSLLFCTPKLEVLQIQGGGMGEVEDDANEPIIAPAVDDDQVPCLPDLHTLAIIAAPHAPIFGKLIKTPLPSLRNLTLTSYHTPFVDEQAAAFVALGLGAGPGGAGFGAPPAGTPPTSTSLFLTAHGPSLIRLTLLSAPDWPPIPFSPPADVLQLAPNLLHLVFSCKSSSPLLYSPRFDKLTSPHPLKTIIMNRPPAGDDMLWFFEESVRGKAKEMGAKVGSGAALLSSTPNSTVRMVSYRGQGPSSTGGRPRPMGPPAPRGKNTSMLMTLTRPSDLKGPDALLPYLHTIQFTSVKWIRIRGARDAGHSAGMKEWKSLLRRWGVRVLDQFGKEE